MVGKLKLKQLKFVSVNFTGLSARIVLQKLSAKTPKAKRWTHGTKGLVNPMNELKPCPFCGGETYMVEVGWPPKEETENHYIFLCDNCQMRCTYIKANDKMGAIRAFNNRGGESNE